MSKFSLTLDDFSPHTHAGLNFETIKFCNSIISKHPGLKIDLFVTAAFGRLGEKPCYLSKNLDWVKKVKDLPSNYSINLHGLFHRRSVADFAFHSTHPASNNDEWQYLNTTQATLILDRILNEFAASNLAFSKVFRCPGWKISVAATKVLIDRGFKIAGDSKYYQICKKSIPDLSKHWISYNWDLISPVSSGDICAFGHTSDWTSNYLNEQKAKLITDVLDKNTFDFKWVKEL